MSQRNAAVARASVEIVLVLSIGKHYEVFKLCHCYCNRMHLLLIIHIKLTTNTDLNGSTLVRPSVCPSPHDIFNLCMCVWISNMNILWAVAVVASNEICIICTSILYGLLAMQPQHPVIPSTALCPILPGPGIFNKLRPLNDNCCCSLSHMAYAC